jgi:hypothetical protein
MEEPVRRKTLVAIAVTASVATVGITNFAWAGTGGHRRGHHGGAGASASASPSSAATARPTGAPSTAAPSQSAASTTSPPGPTGTPSPTKTVAPAATQVLFDDFSYTGSSDPALATHGWSVRTGAGGPGISGASWSKQAVSFGADSSAGGSTVMKLSSSTGGSASSTVQAEVSTNSNKFFTGTYAARVFFNDAPASGADGDAINETFFTITPLRYDDDPIYSELDFEYLPNGGWGDANPTMYNTSWYTYHNSPSWGGDRVSGSTSRSMQGWHTLVMQVVGGTVTYYIDGTQVFTSNGKYYPRQAMALDFNQWFIDGGLISGSGTRTYEEKVDWVYHAAGQTLTPADVTAQVTALRSAGTTFTDTVPAA